MNVMYISDDNYVDLLGISILSLLENNKDMLNIDFYIVDDGIRRENRSKISDLVQSYGRKVNFLKKPNMEDFIGQRNWTGQKWWPTVVYARLLLEEVFSEYSNIDRVLYLDCDTMICGDLGDMWRIELGEYIAAGVGEAMGNLHKKAIGLEKRMPYFNSGVLLIDLNKWRVNSIDKQMRDFLKEKQGEKIGISR